MTRKIFLLTCAAVLAYTSTVYGATIHVPGDQPTIQAAIDTATTNDVILVSPGTYTENIDFSGKSIVVRSEAGSALTSLRPVYPSTPTVKFISGEGAGASIEGFTFTGSTSNVIVVLATSTAVIRGNRFVDNPVYDVAIRTDGSNPLIEYNLFVQSASISCVGIFSGTARIINNTFDRNTRGFFTISGQGIAKNNIVTNSTEYGVYGTFTEFDYNDIWNNNPNYAGGSAVGPHDLSQNPLFLDFGLKDYGLQPHSPCIDAGDPNPAYNDPDGTRNDMGAAPASRDVPYAAVLGLGPESAERVVSHSPVFFWTFFDTVGSQVSYELQVGTDTLWESAEMWSSGQVPSPDTSALYSGATLLDGNTYFWRIRLNDGVNWGGWRSARFHMNSIPSTPLPHHPIAGELAQAGRCQLFVNNSTDADSDPLFYDFQIFSDPGLSVVVGSKSGIAQAVSPTGSNFFAPLLIGVQYWWVARAFDAYEYSGWSSPESFTTRTGTIRVPFDRSTIAAGISGAWDGDTVLIAPGTYSEQINPLGKAIVIRGTPPVGNTIVLKVSDGVDVVTVASGEGSGTVIEGLTIQGAVNANGIRVSGSSPQILGNIITGNSAFSNGGGILVESGNPTIRGNQFLNNASTIKGGGIYLANGTSATIDSNTFYFNSCTDGGGAIAKIGSGTLNVTRNVMYGNSNTDDWGGVIYAEQAPGLLIEHNTIVGSWTTSTRGSGITILNPNGGQIKDNVVAFNKGGYGVYILLSGGTAPQVTYNDLWANESGACFGVAPGTGSISGDPLICDTTIHDFRLASGSPCLGTGSGGSNIGALGQGCDVSGPQPPTLTDIEISMSSDSLHVVDHAPRFSWRYNDPYARPLVKSQIEVGTDMDWVVAEMWQPTIMIGPDTAVQYAGEPLLDGQTYYMRIRVATDTLWSNWLVAPFRMNSIPSAPTPLFPTPGSIATTGRPSVVVMNSTDAQNDALHYDFEVYRDSALTMLAAYIAGVNGGPGQTTWKVDSLTSENQYHYWRARASDGHENGPWSPVWTFIVDAFNQPPVAFNLVSPGSGETVPDLTPTFAWDPAVDPDPGSTLTYTVTLGLNPSFTFKSEISGIAATTLDWPDSLTLETNYWWKVKADDGRGGTVTSSVQSFKTGSLGDLTGDGIVDVFDIIKEIDVAFGGGLPPNPPSLADVNGDCVTDVFDVIYLIHYVFEGGAGPMPGCAP